jgi:hypothetical protein
MSSKDELQENVCLTRQCVKAHGPKVTFTFRCNFPDGFRMTIKEIKDDGTIIGELTDIYPCI